jgi:hypothetical protein
MDPGIRLIELLRELVIYEQVMPIKLLRSEACLLALIKSEPGNPVKYYMSKMDISYRGFFNVLQTLSGLGLISEGDNPNDRRQKLLS